MDAVPSCQAFIAVPSQRSVVALRQGGEWRDSDVIPMSELRRWIEELIEQRYGTASKLADAIGMSVSAFSRSTKAGTLSTENLLRLALETGEAAPKVFERAGKGEVSALIEQLYGRAVATPDAERKRLLALYDALASDDGRRAVLQMLDAFPKTTATATRRDVVAASRRGRQR